MRFQVEKRVEGLVFPESLRWWDNQLWFVDMYDGRVCRYAPSTGITHCVFNTPTILGGLARHVDGRVLVVDKPARRILAISASQTEVFADLSALGSSPLNEMISLPDGTFLVDEYGFNMRGGEAFRKGRIFHVDSAGRPTPVPGLYSFPNGMSCTADGRAIIVAESMGRRLTHLSASLDTPGAELFRFESGHPDGLDHDRDGNIWCALAGTPLLECISSDGELLARVSVPAPAFDVCVATAGDSLFVATSATQESDLSLSERPRTGIIFEIELPLLEASSKNG